MTLVNAQFENEVPGSEDRRGWVRHVCGLKGDCQPMAFLSTGGRWPIRAKDISHGGVALLVSRRFEPNTLLAVELQDTEAQTITLPLARVQRAEKAGNLWLLGCAWVSALDVSALENLLGAIPMSQAAFASETVTAA